MHLTQDEGACQEVCPVKGFWAGMRNYKCCLVFRQEATHLPVFPGLGALVRVSTSAGNSNLS